MKNFRTEHTTIGKDKWEILYARDNTFSVCVRVEVGLLRPNRKWYQFKHTYTDYTYCIGNDEVVPTNLRVRAQRLIAHYYATQEAIDKVNDFFEEETENDDA